MILGYLSRLLFISLAVFFLAHLVLGLLVALVTHPALRFARRMEARLAARWMMMLRLLPAAGAIFLVLAVCLPSYLWLEPDAPAERVGFVSLGAALLAATMWGISLARVWRAAVRSRRLSTTDRDAPNLALAGILRPRLIVSPAVRRALTPAQLAAAMRHERAHWTSRDNLKRLCMLLAPPFALGGKIDCAWQMFSEWAADDYAADGSADCACALAEALVRVARLSANSPVAPLAATLIGDRDELAARVDRLLRADPSAAPSAGGHPILAFTAMLATAGATAIALFNPEALASVHRVLERLIS